jgi:hypothetical protein
VSRNARRERTDGAQERFVTQRCHGAGLTTAEDRLHALLETLRAADQEVLDVEQEYVVVDDRLAYDDGWFTRSEPARWLLARELKNRSAPAGKAGFPPTYQPVAVRKEVWQKAVFDPALKHYENAYRAGEPAFRDPAAGRRWTAGRREAINHILAVLADTPWATSLVLRGSVAMAAWIGWAAREPGDLDFVVTPSRITSDGPEARALLDGITAAITAAPGAGLRPQDTAQSAIWTYERADGRRLVIPFSTVDAPDGSVQIDIVFGEKLPTAPAPLVLPDLGTTVLAATAELSLAWKLLWLATDWYPQGKDLYDATLLAEHTTVDVDLVRDLIRPELGAEAETFTAMTVLTWKVDWKNFADEHPSIPGTAGQWLRRLALALDRAWT